jgi:hypothetical protein
MLGSEGSKVRLLLRLNFADLPGFCTLPDGSPDDEWSGKVPGHIEQMKKQFTTSPSGDRVRVDVLWQAMFYEAYFESSAREMETVGWNVVKIEKDDGLWRRSRTTVTFRRKSMEISGAH